GAPAVPLHPAGALSDIRCKPWERMGSAAATQARGISRPALCLERPVLAAEGHLLAVTIVNVRQPGRSRLSLDHELGGLSSRSGLGASNSMRKAGWPPGSRAIAARATREGARAAFRKAIIECTSAKLPRGASSI